MLQRPLTEDERAELDALNEAITAALAARKAWLDTKMVETSTLKVGDEIYDVNSGAMLGEVTGLYRYWADRNDLLDTSHHCHYEYRSLGGSNSNTSSESGRSFGAREDALRYAEMRTSALRGSL